MIKRLTSWRVQSGVDRDQALQHWRGPHADLVRLVPGLRRYVQNHAVVGPEGTDVAYTGLGEVWFDSIEAATAATRTEQWSAVIADAGTFMDLGSVVAVWAEEHEILGD